MKLYQLDSEEALEKVENIVSKVKDNWIAYQANKNDITTDAFLSCLSMTRDLLEVINYRCTDIGLTFLLDMNGESGIVKIIRYDEVNSEKKVIFSIK